MTRRRRWAGLLWLALAGTGGALTVQAAADTSPARHGDDYLLLEDFAGSPIGGLPTGWAWRSKDDDKPKPYRVRHTAGGNYVVVSDTGSSVILMRRVSWNPLDYPVMTWCWRATTLPPGGDERFTKTNDSAVGVYVVFSTNWLGIPHQLKYVWSTTLPVGAVGRRKGIGRPWFRVLESGPDRLGDWTFEQVDLVDDHRRILGGKPDNETIGLGILTDANSTHSLAEGAYADFRVWRRSALVDGKAPADCSCLQGAALADSMGAADSGLPEPGADRSP